MAYLTSCFVTKAERLEKEKLKQLTLNINQRIEQEEFQQGKLTKTDQNF